MATKKKAQPATPLACKCGRSAAVVKIGKVYRVFCSNAYCPENIRAGGSTINDAVKQWNTAVTAKEAKK